MSKRLVLGLVIGFFVVWIALVAVAMVGVKVFGWGEAVVPLAIFVPPFLLCLVSGGSGEGGY